MIIEQAHELLLNYGFKCFKTDICWCYGFNTIKNEKCIYLFPSQNKISFKDCVIYRTLDNSFNIAFGTIFFKSDLDDINEDYLKMEIEEYLMKYKKKLVELQKLELDKEFS